jgi:hypothetical protein
MSIKRFIFHIAIEQVPYHELQMTLDNIVFQYVLFLSLSSRILLPGAGLGQPQTDATTSL